MAGFQLNQANAIGFDMDHSLVRYKQAPLQELVYNCLRDHMVEFNHYDERLKQFSFDVNLCSKGIIVDSVFGNFLKIDASKFVVRGYHGTKPMSRELIGKMYPEAIDFEACDVVDTVSTPKRFKAWVTAFDFPALGILAHLIDFYEESSSNRSIQIDFKFYCKIQEDLHKSFEYIFGDFNRGAYFKAIREDVGKYVYSSNSILSSKSEYPVPLFLITNSFYEYTDLLMKFVFGVDWRVMFDAIIVKAGKPTWFSSKSPFYKVELTETNEVTEFSLGKGKVFYKGNWGDFHSKLVEYCKIPDPKIVYFGDHLISDVYACSKTPWLTASVVEELYHENDYSLAVLSQRNADRVEYIPVAFSDNWGSFFSDKSGVGNPNPNETNTYWHQFVVSYSNLSIGTIELDELVHPMADINIKLNVSAKAPIQLFPIKSNEF